MIKYTNMFYCASTRPAYDDKLNFLNPPDKSLWFFRSDFHIIGYPMAMAGVASLNPADANKKAIAPETVISNGVAIIPAASARVMFADVMISKGNTAASKTSTDPTEWTKVHGGFWKDHLSAHLKGSKPAGGNLGFKDGHVEWRPFSQVTCHTTGTPGFWW
jgi:hypothetical protein